MSGSEPMHSARRRPIPGMVSHADSAPPPPAPLEADEPVVEVGRGPAADARSSNGSVAHRESGAPDRDLSPVADATVGPTRTRRPAADYASTRLVNFRIPVDLHERYKHLVREVEQKDLRLRHPSLTEVLIGLLEEGPHTADEIAAVIRRKRVSEHGTEHDA